MNKMDLLKNLGTWNFDFKVIILTLVVAPLALIFIRIIVKYLKEWGTYVLEALMYHCARALRANLAGMLTLKRYCRLRLGEENRYLFVPSSLGIKLEVDTAYVTLSLDHHTSGTSVLDHSNLLDIGNRIRVIGDPGAGKSSLVKRLMRDSCRQAHASPKRSRLPILLELKKLVAPPKTTKDFGAWFLQKLRQEAEKSNVFEMGDCFDTYVGDAGLLVLLDGLDEVSSADHPRIQAAIEALSMKLGQLSEKNTIVLTMRTQFHIQVKDFYRESFGHAVTLRPFTPTNIYEFLSRWPFSRDSRENVNRIYKQLTDRASLREMCGNPLVLSMYVAEDQAQGNLVAPESRTEFYKKVTEELLILDSAVF